MNPLVWNGKFKDRNKTKPDSMKTVSKKQQTEPKPKTKKHKHRKDDYYETE